MRSVVMLTLLGAVCCNEKWARVCVCVRGGGGGGGRSKREMGERERVKKVCFLLHFATSILLFALARLSHLPCLFVWVLECLRASQ